MNKIKSFEDLKVWQLAIELELIDPKYKNEYNQLLLDIRNLGIKLNNLISAVMKRSKQLNDN